jgi:glucan 1,3-beta-glucosidase
MAEFKPDDFNYIRGVNIGGWLVLENYITPYFFSLTDCHLKGDFRFYKGQIDAPPASSPLYKPMDEAARKKCKPLPKHPVDEWSMTSYFRDANQRSSAFAKQYLDIHYDNFVTREDIAEIKASGASHVRVPVGHWILGDIKGNEPYVEGGWKYFKRMVGWCKEEGIQVWPDLHTAPGSQNGFDNSGHRLGTGSPTCSGWDHNHNITVDGEFPYNVKRTLRIIDQITSTIVADGMRDVVTGFGLLNDPFNDCNFDTVKEFYNQGLEIVRKNMGQDTAVYVGDMFNAGKFNSFWTTDEFKGTYMDSHLYQSFVANARHLSPRQHIALVW